MISVAEARNSILRAFHPLSTEIVHLTDGLGRVLAEDICSRLTQPFADVSAMDGYAVRSADILKCPVKLKLVGESAAGNGFSKTIDVGEAVRIFTGAPLPQGADCIVIQENADQDSDSVIINESVLPGRFIRRAGLDFKKGETLLRNGKCLTARDIGIAAAMNISWLNVRRKPRVAILATGNEISMPGDPVGPDQITSSNSFSVAGYVRSFGGEPVILGVAEDTQKSLEERIEASRGCDLLVTIGGASVGDYDLVGDALKNKGLDLGFYRVAMRPGKPLIFGSLGDMPVMGLPGNPVSVGVTSLIFLQPAMAAMLGLTTDIPALEPAILGRNLKANDAREDYIRATLELTQDGKFLATPFEHQDSSMMVLFANSECLIVRAPLAAKAKIGDAISIIRPPRGPISF